MFVLLDKGNCFVYNKVQQIDAGNVRQSSIIKFKLKQYLFLTLYADRTGNR